MARRPVGDRAMTGTERRRLRRARRRQERKELARAAEKMHEPLPKEKPPRIDRLEGSVATASEARSGGSAQQISKLIYWIASVLGLIAVGLAVYVAVAGQLWR
jgi:hypothetical protein